MCSKTTISVGFCLAAGLAASSAALAAPINDGDAYPGWGLFGGGQNFAAFDLGAGLSDIASDSVVGPDGSLYVAGTVQDANGLSRIGVAKFDPGGILDTSFSTDGMNTSLEANVHATSVALTADNRLLVAGYKVVNGTDHDFIVCRFSAISGANLNFPAPVNTACVKPVFLPGTRDVANDIAVQDDGKFVIGGTVDTANQAGRAGFARFLANGQPDLDFGTLQGSNMALVRTENIFVRHAIEAIAIAGNGKIVGVGQTLTVGATNTAALVIRLNPDGTPDQLTQQVEYPFYVSPVNNGDNGLRDVALAPDPGSAAGNDHIIASGWTDAAGGNRGGLIVKVRSNGNVLANDFGISDGHTVAPINGMDISFESIARQPGGSFVVAGNRPGTDGLDIAVQRFTRHGTPDLQFGNGGGVFVDFGFPEQLDLLGSVRVLGDAIYVAGYSYRGASNYDFTVAKLGLDRIFQDDYEVFD
jgi:uncharacterized delta-60 repeat protein